MKVRDLKALLENFDDDLDVTLVDPYNGADYDTWSDMESYSINEMAVRPEFPGSDTYFQCDPGSRLAKLVVAIGG